MRRKPILFVFGSEYAPAFIAANKRAAAARGGRPGDRRPITPTSTPRLSAALPVASGTKGPKSKSEANPQVIMGPLVKETGIPAQPSAPSALDLALQRLGQAIGEAGSGKRGAK